MRQLLECILYHASRDAVSRIRIILYDRPQKFIPAADPFKVEVNTMPSEYPLVFEQSFGEG